MTATLKNVPIKATATSKMREEKAKAGTVVSSKQPMKAFRHQGIPIILQNQKQSDEEAAKAKRSKPVVRANSVQIKLYEKDKEIRAKLESERQKEIERERQMALFKASDAKVLSKRPFMPRQCDKDPVRPRELNLHTDLRSEERQKFDQAIKEKEAKMEAAKQQVSDGPLLNWICKGQWLSCYRKWNDENAKKCWMRKSNGSWRYTKRHQCAILLLSQSSLRQSPLLSLPHPTFQCVEPVI